MRQSTIGGLDKGESLRARGYRRTAARLSQAAGEMFDVLESRQMLSADPSLSSVYVSPATVPFIGQPVTIYPIAATSNGVGELSRTLFYFDTNDDGILQADQNAPVHDRIIGVDRSGADGWSATVATDPGLGFHTGVNRVFAQVFDRFGSSAALSRTFSIGADNSPPVIAGFAASPNPVTRGSTTTLTATGLTDPDGSATNVEFYLGTGGNGVFQPATGFASHATPYSVAVGDFNGDGVPDLVTANVGSNDTSVLLGNDDGTFQAAFNYATGSNPYTVTVGDFNGDGKADLATANAGSNSASVLLGNGDGTFQAAVNYAVGSNPRFVTSGDFNNDGRLDLAVANKGGNTVSILLANAFGGFTTASQATVGNNPRSIAVGDFNGDGSADMAVVDVGSNNVAVVLGDGFGNFGAPAFYGVGTNPYYITAGDANGDGRLDLAVANESSNNVSVLLGNTNGTFRSAVNYTVGGLPRSVAMADFNGDGRLDLVVVNRNDDSVSLLLGNGDGTFQSRSSWGVGDGPQTVAVADFNLDGVPDVAVSNAATNNVSILLGDAGFLAGNARLLGTATVSHGQATLTINTSGLPAGPITVFARAKDNRGSFGTIRTTILQVANRNPTIGSLTASANPVLVRGDMLTLTARNAADSDGRVAGVRFYRAADYHSTTLDLSTAVVLGEDRLPAGGYAITFNTSNGNLGFVEGSNRVFAVVTDNDGGTTVTSLLVRINARPSIDSIFLDNSNIDRGGSVTATAQLVRDGTENPAFAGGIAAVRFYLDLNNNHNVDATDRLIGAGVRETGTSSYNLTFSTRGLTLGAHRMLVQATDNTGGTSVAYEQSFNVSDAAPTLTGVRVTPGTVPFLGQSITIAPVGAADSDGTVTGARFYYDSNNDGILQDDQTAINHDQLIGVDTSAAGGWSLGVATQDGLGFHTGVNRVWVQLLDSDGSSAARAATFTITAANQLPTVGALTTPGAPVIRGNTARLTASGLADGDGSVSSVEFYLNTRGDATFGSPTAQSVGSNPFAVAVGDFNGDGVPDFATANHGSNNVSIRLGVGDGSFLAAVSYAVGSQPRSVAVGDFNGDGKTDLVAATQGTNTVSVLLGNGNGSFQNAVSYTVGAAVFSATVGDFNRDGKADIAATNFNDGTVSILLGNGDGTFRAAVNYGADNGPHSVTSGDFNGDGKPDLAVVNYWSSQLSILVGNGDGTFRAAVNTLVQLNAAPEFVTTGDLNGDGKADLVIASTNYGAVFVLLGNGNGTFRDPVSYATGPHPYSVAIADFNGDGVPDLAAANYNGGNSVSVLLGRGGGVFQPKVDWAVGGNPIGLAVGDFNLDGTPDIATANDGSANASIILADTQFLSGHDRLLGTATVTGGQAVLDISTAGLPPGPLTVYARARDNRGGFGAVRSAVLRVADRAPTVASLTGAPSPVVRLGDTLTLTAGGLADADGSVVRVEFFVDSNNNGTFDLGTDRLIGADYSSAGGYSLAFDSGDPALALITGTNRFFARVVDNDGGSATRGVVVRINARPNIDALIVSTGSVARGGMVTLTAQTVADGTETPPFAGTISGVQFYLDLNGNNQIDPTDRLLGAGVRSTSPSDWALTFSTAGLPLGDKTVLARATDNNGAPSVVRGQSFTVVNADPAFTSTSVTPGTVPFLGQVITISPIGAADPDGSIARVYFYYDTNNDGVLQPDQSAVDHDQLIGVDNSAAGGWNARIASGAGLGFHTGSNRVWAQVVDNLGASSARAATFTITAANQPATIGGFAGPLAPVTRGATATLTASGFADGDGTATSVEFYLSPGGDGTFQSAVNLDVGGPDSVIAGDFNGDGIPDLAVADYDGGQVQILLGTGNGVFGAPASFGVGPGTNVVTSGDFNGDGVLDLATANDNGNAGVSVLIGNGDGTFQPVVNYDQTREAFWVSVADFNRDGVPDLAAIRHDDNVVSVLLGNGDGTFQSPVDYATGALPTGQTVADFNGDGFPDLATTNYDDGSVSILLGRGDGTFLPKADVLVGESPSAVSAGDFNGDGKTDLAVFRDSPDNLSILLGNGNGTFRAAVSYHGGGGDLYGSVAMGDLNSDGKMDIALPVNNAHGIAIRFGNGDGTFGSETILATGTYPDFVTAADVTGDGTLDLLVSNYNSHTISVLRGNTQFLAGHERLLGTATIVGGHATLNLSTAGLPAGPITVYARAKDNRGGFGPAVSARLTVGNRAPTVSSLTGTPNPVVLLGNTFTLTAGGVADADGRVDRVEFFSDTNSNGVVDPGVDVLLGADYSSTGGYTLAVNTVNSAFGLSTGDRKFIARVIDNDGGSATRVTTVRINARPVVGSFALTTPGDLPILRSGSFTLTLSGVTDDASIAGISLFRDSSGDGTLSATDLLLGAATRVGTSNTWTFSRAGSSLVAGTYKLFARVTDSSGATTISQLLVTVI